MKNPLPRPKDKLFASVKIAVFILVVFVPARVLTVDTTRIEDDWDLYVTLFVLVVAGVYLTITFALWANRKWGRN